MIYRLTSWLMDWKAWLTALIAFGPMFALCAAFGLTFWQIALLCVSSIWMHAGLSADDKGRL